VFERTGRGWQARFQPTNFASPTGAPWNITLIAGGNGGAVGGIIQGPTGDKRFKDIMTGSASETCNDVFKKATANVATAPSAGRRESLVWDTFDVRR